MNHCIRYVLLVHFSRLAVAALCIVVHKTCVNFILFLQFAMAKSSVPRAMVMDKVVVPCRVTLVMPMGM